MALCSDLTAKAIPCLPAAADEAQAIRDCCLSCMALDDGRLSDTAALCYTVMNCTTPCHKPDPNILLSSTSSPNHPVIFFTPCRTQKQRCSRPGLTPNGGLQQCARSCLQQKMPSGQSWRRSTSRRTYHQSCPACRAAPAFCRMLLQQSTLKFAPSW